MIYVIIVLVVVVVLILVANMGSNNTMSSDNTKVDLDFKAKSSRENINATPITALPTDSIKWEIVNRKSDRWIELGFGEGESFPGYGKLYEREFDVWYCDVGSKIKNDLQKFHDVYPLNYDPKDRPYDVLNVPIGQRKYKRSSEITGENIVWENLQKSGDYEILFSGLDKKNRRRWYFGLSKYIPTGIEAERAVFIKEEESVRIIDVPEGWNLVSRKSKEWFENGFGDGHLFPGYGQIYSRVFDVWYCNIGSKEKHSLAEFRDKAIQKFYNGICGDYQNLKIRNLHFENLSKTQGYLQLLTVLDEKERKRWYFGLKICEPTFLYTTSEI